MPFDSLIKLRQLNNPELSGYIELIIGRRITGVVLSGTGLLTGEFYPLHSNPSGYLTGVNTGDFVTNSSLAVSQTNVLNTVGSLYYLKSNPSGFISKTTTDANYVRVYPFANSGVKFVDNASATTVLSFQEGSHFYIQSHQGASIIDVSGTNYGGSPTISGFSIHATGIKVNGKDVLTDTGAWVSTLVDTINTRLYLYDGIIVNQPFAFKQNSVFWLRGYNDYAIIDLYDSTRDGNKPYISGFEIDARTLKISGVSVNLSLITGTGNGTFTGITQAQLLAASGSLHTVDVALDADIQTLRANLVITGSRIGPPSTTPNVFYLTKDAAAYNEKLLKAFSTTTSLIEYITGNLIKDSLVYVGTGYFGAKTIGGNYNFGNITFGGLYNQPQTTQVDFTFSNSTGNIYTYNGTNINYTIGTGAVIRHKNYGGYSASTIIVSSLGSGFFDGLDNLTISESSTNGNLTVLNSNVTSLTAANYRRLSLESCIVNNVSASTNLVNTGITLIKCILSGSTQLPISSGGGPFLVFNNCGKDYAYNRSFYLTGGALGFDSRNLWLTSTNTGTLITQQLLTKNSGDALYYSVSNPQGFVDLNYITTFFTQLTDAVLLDNATHNTNLNLRDDVHGMNPFIFNGVLFYLVPTGGGSQAIIDIYGTSDARYSGLPWISGFHINTPALYTTASGTYIDNIPLNSYITGFLTGITGTIGGGGTTIISGGPFAPFVVGQYSLPTGEASTGFIGFGYTFEITPRVIGTFVNDSGDPIILFNLSGITTTGFYLNCSDTISTTNYKFDYIATTGDSYINGVLQGLNTGALTGIFYPRYDNPLGYLTSGSLTGTSANPFVIAQYSVPTGEISTGFISFGYTFLDIPKVVGTFVNNSGDPLLVFDLSGVTTTGFYINCSDVISTTNYKFDYFASTGNGYVSLVNGVVVGGGQDTGSLTGAFYPRFSNPNAYLTTGSLSGVNNLNVTGTVLSGNIFLTGIGTITLTTSGQFIIISGATGGGGAAAGVTSLGITGIVLTNAITLTGFGNITMTSTGQFIMISGSTGSLATAANLAATGNTIINSLASTGNTLATSLALTGQKLAEWTGLSTSLYANINHTHAGGITGVTGITTSGSVPITGLATFTGIGGLSVILSGNTILFSGGAGGTGSFYPLDSNPSGYLTSATLGDELYVKFRYLV